MKTCTICCEQVVLVLKECKVSMSAASIAVYMGTDSRAVATAVRAAVNDGRVSRHYRKPSCGATGSKGMQVCAFYRFKRMKSNPKMQALR